MSHLRVVRLGCEPERKMPLAACRKELLMNMRDMYQCSFRQQSGLAFIEAFVARRDK